MGAQKQSDDGNKVDASMCRLISDVDPERVSKHLFYLSKDPLLYRKLNLTLPGHEPLSMYHTGTGVGQILLIVVIFNRI